MSQTRPAETLIVGTRGSTLARAQTQWVIDQLQRAHPALNIRMEIITTSGDRLSSQPLPEIGGKGLFTAELEQALRDDSIDLAVHSAKDLPTEKVEGLSILAYSAREDPRDAWVSADGVPFDELEPGATIGTSSLRRQSQLLMFRPHLQFVSFRGNVETRIKKVKRGDAAGAVLAMAGLKRANLAEVITHAFKPEVLVPAPGQGALALQGRSDDDRVRQILAEIHDEPTAQAVACEREILHQLDAGCRAPVGVHVFFQGDRLFCRALVATTTGDRSAGAYAEVPCNKVDTLVEQIMTRLLAGGAEEIIAACRL